jgi:hypothetical protein
VIDLLPSARSGVRRKIGEISRIRLDSVRRGVPLSKVTEKSATALLTIVSGEIVISDFRFSIYDFKLQHDLGSLPNLKSKIANLQLPYLAFARG